MGEVEVMVHRRRPWSLAIVPVTAGPRQPLKDVAGAARGGCRLEVEGGSVYLDRTPVHGLAKSPEAESTGSPFRAG